MCLDSGPEARRRNDGKCALYNFSAFVVEIEGRWFAITAGHIFRKLKEATACGSIISDWQIDDSIVSSKPKEAYRISVNIDLDVIWLYEEDDGFDYACLELGYLTQEALKKEGISAVSQDLWQSDDIEEFTLWLLVGTPMEFARLVAGEPVEKSHATIQLERSAEVPGGLTETEYKRLYAKIHFESVMEGGSGFNIEGMSGGPIFGLRPFTESSPYEYRLIGVQSAWNRKDSVAICAAYPFIQAIRQRITANTVPPKPDA
ncbi:hypothetical protein JY96_21805 [Aquabacterium sp. NJ1]|nr:hypothetical protein JY96_21805 [Aquabacterium sp. NJ1]